MSNITQISEEINIDITEALSFKPTIGVTGINSDDKFIDISTNLDIPAVKKPDLSKIEDAEKILDGVTKPSLSSRVAAVKTRGGSSLITTKLPESYINDFVDEIETDITKTSTSIDWIVPSLWFRGQLWMIAGDPGVGKTSVLVSTLKEVSVGNPIFCDTYLPRKPHNVLYINADSSKLVFDNTYRKKLNLDSYDNFKVIPWSDVVTHAVEKLSIVLSANNANFTKILDTFIKKYKSDIVVLDTFAPFLLTADENNSKDMVPLMSNLRSWAAKAGVLLILVHHFRKRSTNAKGDSSAHRTLEDVGGSRGIYGQCDSVMSIESRYDEFGKKIDRSGSINVLKEGSSGTMKHFPKVLFDVVNDSIDRYHVEFSIDDSNEESFSDMEFEVLKQVRNGNNTFKGIFLYAQNLPGSSKRTLQRIVSGLVEDEYLSFKGFSRNRKYELTKKGLSKINTINIEKNVIINEEKTDEFDLSYNTELVLAEEKELIAKELEELKAFDLDNKKTYPDFIKDSIRKNNRDLRLKTMGHIKEIKLAISSHKNDIELQIRNLVALNDITKSVCDAKIMSMRDTFIRNHGGR